MDLVKTLAAGRPVVVAAALLAGLSGCGTDPAATTDPGATPPPTTATASPVASPVASPGTPDSTDLPGTPTASPPQDVVAVLKAQLLPSAEVPGLNARWQWQDGKTRRATTTGFGVCGRVDLATIGATDVLERTYYPPDDSDDSAAQQVAQFADTKSVDQAWSVLASWRASCAGSNPDLPGLVARDLISVDVPAGQARWYLVSWEPSGEETGRFEAFGMVRNGTTLTLLRITNSGQDYNYPVGKEPMVAMLRAAADRLAR